MNREAEAVPDAASSPHYGSSNIRGKKKVWERANTKKTENKDQSPKGSTLELKGHYFFTTQDDQNNSQDHYRATMEAIGRFMHRKAEGSQDLTEFFDCGKIPTLTLPEEPLDPATRTQEVLWNMQLKVHSKKHSCSVNAGAT